MHTDDIFAYTHEHIFDQGNPAAERGTRAVMWVTATMMVVEIAGGLDSTMGIVGAIVVAVWARGLIKQTDRVLLDSEMDHPVVQEIREALESPQAEDGSRVADLHVWRVGRQSFAAALTLVTYDATLTAARVREALAVHQEIAHVTVEIQWCPPTPH